jgi:uncharacterized membrane protein SpoIIM required for sporulation
MYFLAIFIAFVALGSLGELPFLTKIFSGQYGFFNPLETQISFQALMFNNIGVLLLGFLFAFIFEFGTTFVVVRNAIFWGLTLGFFINSFSGNPIGLLLIFPHLILEASGYFVSSIAGGVMSKSIIEEKIESERFRDLFTQVLVLLLVSILLVILAAGIETIVFNQLFPRIF